MSQVIMNKIYKSELFRLFMNGQKIYLSRTGYTNEWYWMVTESDLKDARWAYIGNMIYKVLNA